MDAIEGLKRHVCIVCKSKKQGKNMIKHGSHWTCISCISSERSAAGSEIGAGALLLQVLNLYCGIGGNRKLWNGCHITAIENNPKVAAAYKRLYPNDTVIICDAHSYLLKNFYRFDFIWSSPPCQTHSHLNYFHQADAKRYIDLSLWQQIILLQHFFKGKYLIENVDMYYPPLLPPTAKIDRHLIWCNFPITKISLPKLNYLHWKRKQGGDDIKMYQEYLGIELVEKIYLSSKKAVQIYRNCVHPLMGKSLFDDYIRSMGTRALRAGV